jgi:transposase-like protein
MHCPACQRAMMSTSYQVFEDERGAMTISRWRCRPCRETAEEIRLSAGYRGPEPTRIHYAVASQPVSQVTIPARVRAKRGAPAHAVAL